jgi:hypothetical protein
MVLQSVYLTPSEFESLPEYSCSVPTEIVDGKKWKHKAQNNRWVMGEYDSDGYSYRIIWRLLEILPEDVEPRPI